MSGAAQSSRRWVTFVPFGAIHGDFNDADNGSGSGDGDEFDKGMTREEIDDFVDGNMYDDDDDDETDDEGTIESQKQEIEKLRADLDETTREAADKHIAFVRLTRETETKCHILQETIKQHEHQIERLEMRNNSLYHDNKDKRLALCLFVRDFSYLRNARDSRKEKRQMRDEREEPHDRLRELGMTIRVLQKELRQHTERDDARDAELENLTQDNEALKARVAELPEQLPIRAKRKRVNEQEPSE